MDKTHIFTEAIITINGLRLSRGQAMTVRVAMDDFSSTMAIENALGKDKIGEAIRKNYLSRANEIIKIIHLMK